MILKTWLNKTMFFYLIKTKYKLKKIKRTCYNIKRIEKEVIL